MELIGVGESDHLGTLVSKQSREVRTCTRTTKKRIYKNFDPTVFQNDLKEVKDKGLFAPLFKTNDIDVATEHFTTIYTSVLDKHAPLKVIQNRNSYIPYISEEIKVLMKRRDALKIEAAQDGNINKFNQYKVLRNEVTKQLRIAKSQHYCKKVSDTNDSKEMWQLSSQILNKNRRSFPSQNQFSLKEVGQLKAITLVIKILIAV